MAQIRVKVTPGARENAVAGWVGDVLKVRVRAAPERGKANEAVCAVIASALGVAPRDVTVSRGQASREKVVEVAGVPANEVRRRLGAPMF
jgi:uncharacterized protein (TIGR00251 family)